GGLERQAAGCISVTRRVYSYLFMPRFWGMFFYLEGRKMKYSGISKLAGVMMLCFAGAATAGGPDAAQLEIGKALFKSGAVPACAICHTLKDAEAEGTIGPNLDEQKPDFAVVRKFVEEG